jgi:hypothetical protein
MERSLPSSMPVLDKPEAVVVVRSICNFNRGASLDQVIVFIVFEKYLNYYPCIGTCFRMIAGISVTRLSNDMADCRF